jgi:hypothetical protein
MKTNINGKNLMKDVGLQIEGMIKTLDSAQIIRLADLNPAETLLTIIDMNNGFAKAGSLYSPFVKAIIPDVVKLVKACEANGIVTIAYTDTHTSVSKEFENYPIHCLEDSGEDDLIDDVQDNLHNFKKKPKQNILQKDLDNIPEIKQLQQSINYTKKNLDAEEDFKCKKQLRGLLSDMKRHQIDIKNGLLRPIEFKAVLPDETKYNFDSDTGYYLADGNYQEVSNNRINFGNPKHIYYLIRYYSELKQQTYNDVHSDMRYILKALEYLIDNSDLKDYERDIVTWKIDNLSRTVIVDNLMLQYEIEWTPDRLSKGYTAICKKISKYYWDSYEEWFYTYKAKADYKQCSQCGENKVAIKKYFAPDNRSKNGLDSRCKECEQSRKKNG